MFDLFGGESGAGLSAPALPNLWLGTSVENQKAADERIPHLLPIPAAVHFVSAEPMLGPIDVKPYVSLRQRCEGPKGCGFEGASYEFYSPRKKGGYRCPECGKNHTYLITDSVDWLIVGCESSKNRRPCNIEWVRDLVEQCDTAGVAVYVKQLDINGKVNKNPDEWPAWARWQEYPKGMINE